MNSTTIGTNMRIRSHLFKGGKDFNVQEDDQFTHDVLSILPGPVDLGAVQSLRKNTHSMEEIHRLRVADKYFLQSIWSNTMLVKMQLSTKPISERMFCLNALAFAMDSGVDLPRLVGSRLVAVGLALHRRVGKDSKLAALGTDVLAVIARLSVY